MECAVSCGRFSLNKKFSLGHKNCIRKKVTVFLICNIHPHVDYNKKIHRKIVRVGRNNHQFYMHNHIYNKHFKFLVLSKNEIFAIVVKEGPL